MASLSLSSANGFFLNISLGLDDLARRLPTGGAAVPLDFLRRAVFFLRQSQNELSLLLPALHLPPGGAWVSEFMDESSSLWEACAAAKAAAVAVERESSAAVKQTHIAAAAVERGMAAAEREIREAMEVMIKLWNTHQVGASCRVGNGLNGLRGALFAMRIVSSLLVKMVVGGLGSRWPEKGNPNPNPSGGEERVGMVWEAAERLKRTVEGFKAPAEEMRRVREAAEEVERERKWEGVERLRAALMGLSAAAEGIVSELDDLFDDMVEARKMVLRICGRW